MGAGTEKKCVSFFPPFCLGANSQPQKAREGFAEERREENEKGEILDGG